MSRYPHPRWYRWLCYLSAGVVAWTIRLWFVTCRVTVIGKDETNGEPLPQQSRSVLYTSWHRGLLYFVYHFRNRQGAIIASRSMAGEFISALLVHLGLVPIRGSSKKGQIDKGGHEALLQMEEYLRRGGSGGSVTDAPHGPAHVSKVGIVVLSQRTGVPIVPVMWAANRYHRFGTWDRMILPYPFSRIVFYYGTPMTVPQEATREEVETIRAELSDRLNRMMAEADQFFSSDSGKER